MYNTLDVAFSPSDIVYIALSNLWWIFALVALLVIGAVIGIIIFNKNKKGSKGDQK